MTVAICLECGEAKFGAFSPCSRCGFAPKSSTEEAKNILLSDHHHTRAELDALSETIRSGHPVVYDPVALAVQERTLQYLAADPDALQCKLCGNDVDGFEDTLCAKCLQKPQGHA